MITLLLLSAAICLGYAAYVQLRFGVASISESFYRFERVKKGLGKLFWGWAVLTAMTLLPVWLEVSGESYQFVAFLSAASLMAVGCFPDYKNEHSLTHPLFTACSSVLAVIWGFLAGIWYVPVLSILLFGGLIIGKHWKTLREDAPHVGWNVALSREKFLFWMEVGAFVGMYLSILIQL